MVRFKQKQQVVQQYTNKRNAETSGKISVYLNEITVNLKNKLLIEQCPPSA